MTPRPLSIAATVLSLSLSQLSASAQCDTLDFEGIPSLTNFTNQYQSCGVVFSSNGVPTPPVTYDYGNTSWTSVLHSYDWYGELRLDFVDPIDGITPVPVSSVSFDNPVGTETDYIVGNAYDVNGVVLMPFTSASPDRVQINTGTANIAYIVMDDDQTTAYVIDNIVINGGGENAVTEHSMTGFSITPTLADEFVTVQGNTGASAELVLVASDGRIVQRVRSTGTSTKFDVRDLAHGTYAVVCQTGATLFTQRFVKL